MSDAPNPWAASPGGDPSNPWSASSSSSPASASTSTSSTPSASLATEVSNLDTILFRFASTPDSKFESTVGRVLPNLLPTLMRSEAEVRAKVIEILNHINRRIKVLPDLQLPVSELVMMYIDPLYNQPIASSSSSSSSQSLSSPSVSASPSPAFFFTFTLLFIEKGFQRLDKREQSILAPHLLVHSASHPVAQQKAILHTFLSSLSSLQFSAGDDALHDKWKFAHNPADRQLVLSFLMDVLLYAPSTSKPNPAASSPSATPSAVGGTGDGGNAANGDANLPEGLSEDAVAFVTKDGKLQWSNDELNKHKVAILAFLSALSQTNPIPVSSSHKFSLDDDTVSAASFSPSSPPPPPLLSEIDVFPHALIASCIGNSDVNREAENLLRRVKQTNVTSPALLSTLFSLFLGSLATSSLPPSQRRAPVGITLRLRILSYLNKSSAAASHSVPLCLKLLFESWFGSLSNYRVKCSAMFFCTHFVKTAGTKELTAVAQVIVNGLLRLLSTLQPEPTAAQQSSSLPQSSTPPASVLTSAQCSTLRGFVYQALGLLSTRVSGLFTRNLKMLQLFFKALHDEQNEETLQQVHEGLTYLRSAFMLTVEEEGGRGGVPGLKALLLGLCESDDKRVRLNALTCLNRLFEFSDVDARWQCLLRSKDSTIEMRDEANKGLQPFAVKDAKLMEKRSRERLGKERETRAKGDQDEQKAEPTSMETEDIMPPASEQEGKDAQAVTTIPSYARMDSTAVANIPYPPFPAFISHVCQQLRLPHPTADAAAASPSRTPLHVDSAMLIHVLDFLWLCFEDGAKQQKLSLSDFACSLSSSSALSLLSYQELLELALLSPISEVQSAASKHLVSLVSTLPAFFAPLYTNRLDWLRRFLLGNSADGRLNTALLLSHIAGHMPSDSLLSLLCEMNATLASASTLSASNLDVVHGSVLTVGVVLTELMRRGEGRGEDAVVAGCLLVVSRLDAATMAREASVSAAACVSVGRIGMQGPLPLPLEGKEETAASHDAEQKEGEGKRGEKKQKAETRDLTRTDAVLRLLELTRGSDRKQQRVTEEAVKALGCIVQGDPTARLVPTILDGLFKLVDVKHEDIHFAVGETLATIADVELPPSAVSASEAPSPSSSPSDLARFPYMQQILSFSMEQLNRGSQVARAASCTWLLCLVKYSRRLPTSSYPPLQSRFTLALTDSHQFTQEAAAKALSLLYEKSDDVRMKEELVATLVRTFTMGQQRVSDDSVVEVDSETGTFSTVKELMSVASDMGQPDLVYKFMEAASHHAAWQSRLGSVFTLHSILLNDAQLKSQVAELVPKLFLYLHDPNTKVRDSMRLMWQSLVDSPKRMVDSQYRPILGHLLRSQNSRQYRIRVAASLGLADLIPHRGWDDVSDSLDELWHNLFRLLDDINGDTRKAAVGLSQTLSELTIRLCDPHYTHNKTHVQQAVDVVLPILLRDGLTSRAKEVQSISIKTLLALIKHGGVFLRPHLSELIGTLLQAMSDQENSALSYLQFHAASLQMSQEDLEVARLSIAKNTPLAEAVSSCLLVVDAASLPSVVHRLTDLLQQGLGLPTLTATGKFIISLVNSPVGAELKEYAGPLMSALVAGLSDASPSVRRVFAAALGSLCRVSKRKRVGRVIESLLSQYTADDAPAAKRLSCGQAVQQIVLLASDSTKEEFFHIIAPYAFLASHDSDEEVRKLWLAVWEEMVPSADSGAVTYQREVTQLCLSTFDAPSWTLRQTTYAAITTLVKSCKGRGWGEEGVGVFARLVVKAMPGRIWAGKEKLFPLAVALAVEGKGNVREEEVRELLRVVLDETRRKKRDYKRDAIRAVGEICDAYDGFDVTAEMKETLQSIFVSATSPDSRRDEDSAAPSRPIGSDVYAHEKKLAQKADQQHFSVAYQCLGRIFPSSAFPSSQREHLPFYLSSITNALRAGLDWSVRVEVLKAGAAVARKVAVGGWGDGDVKVMMASLVEASRDGKQSVVRVKAMDAVLTMLQRESSEVKAWMEGEIAATLRQMLIERRDDTVAEVLMLNEAIRSRLNDITAGKQPLP